MPIATNLTRRLGITHPVLQAPMAGGATTVELVTAVCESGGAGFVAAAYSTPVQIADFCRAVRARTRRPFGVNLFAPSPSAARPDDPRSALERIAPYHAELGIEPPSLPASATESFDAQLAAALGGGASYFSFTFGIPPSDALRAIRTARMFLIGTATTVEEAVALESAGVDAVVAQGSEAGAHRGTFAVPFEAAMVGTVALVPQVLRAIRIPVIASGGIMNGEGIAAALALGAGAVQMGTAFLTCHESGAPESYKRAILAAREHETRVTRAFSGRPARGIVNRFIEEVERSPDAILPYPLQNALTRAMRASAAKQDRPEFLSLWAGQGVRLARRESAGELMSRLASESEGAIRRLAGLVAPPLE
jgi:nitronate monooxygenase